MNPTPPETLENVPSRRGPRKIDDAFEEVARLSGSHLPPTEFYQEFLAKVLAGIEAHAGAVWIRTPQGFLQLQTQLNIDKVGLDGHKNARQCHNELLRQAFQTARPMLLEPFGQTPMMDGTTPAGNLTDFYCHLAPILVDDKTALGLVEIWQRPEYDQRTQRVFLNYVIQMAGYASNYVKHAHGQRKTDQEQVWLQVESFIRQIHSSLDPGEVAHHIVNGGRKLIECDRLSVATRPDRKVIIQAVSGSETVEKRSTEMKAMRRLCEAVLTWGDRLVYNGTRDESLPPRVVDALDDFLAERAAKLLIVSPLVDDRDRHKDKYGEPTHQKPRKPRALLVMECFEPPPEVEPLISRYDTILPHATTALYNAIELKRVPLAWMWRPVAAWQKGLGGKTRAILALIATLLTALTLVLIFVPYALRVDANGQLVPVDCRFVYSPRDGQIKKFLVDPNQQVAEGHPLAEMYDQKLQGEIIELQNGLAKENEVIATTKGRINSGNLPEDEKIKLESALQQSRSKAGLYQTQLNVKQEANNADLAKPGYFRLVAPPFNPAFATQGTPRWMIISTDFRERLSSHPVTPKDPIIRLGNVDGDWKMELKIPQKHLGQVLKAYKSGMDELDVDMVLKSDENVRYKGKLKRSDLGGEAMPTKDDPNDNEPMLISYVRITGPDIPAEYQIPRSQLVTGIDVHSKIRCGDHAMGYSLFYGVWEFIYSKVIFYF